MKTENIGFSAVVLAENREIGFPINYCFYECFFTKFTASFALREATSCKLEKPTKLYTFVPAKPL